MAEPMSMTTSAAATAAKWAWDHQDEVAPKLKKFYRATKRRIFGRSPGVLILGPGGVGKTTLGKILSGEYDYLAGRFRSLRAKREDANFSREEESSR